MSAVPTCDQRGHLDYALAYAAQGWAVVPLYWVNPDGTCGCGHPHDGSNSLSSNSRGKHPHSRLAPHGALSASKDPEVLRRWFADEPRLNVGVATGEVSGIVAVDIDPRDGGDQTWEHFVERSGGEVPDTVIADTGGGGQHILFRYVADQVIRSPGKGIQIKGNGGYIVAEPSTHHSGRAYAWRAEADPTEGAKPAPAPAWLTAPRSADVLKPIKGGGALTGHIPAQRIADLEAALAHLDPDPYSTWVEVGMALHSTEAPEAFSIWDTWSQRSSKYAWQATVRKWNSFHAGNGLHVESVFAWAMQAGWSGETERVAVPAESVKIAAPKEPRSFSGAGLLELPGALGDLVRWANRAAPRPQPPFAVSAALALGSAVCGRRYRGMPRKNWTSLYFVNVGVSGSGKEFARTLIDQVLTEADWPELIGRGGYTSDSAVVSSLERQPVHVSVIDEFGALLKNAQSEGAMHQRSAINALIECWGNVHGILRPKARALVGLPKEQADADLSRIVHQPAISLLGMATPGTFYGALQGGSIEGGFLGRLLITETDIGRQMSADPCDDPVPPSVIAWIKTARAARQTRLGHVGNLAGLEPGAQDPVTPIDVPTDPAALRVWRAYEAELIERQNALDAENIAEIESRRLEQAMRLAVILAVSVDPLAPRITEEIASWCRRYVNHLADQTLAAVRTHMHDSKFAAWQADALRCIQGGGAKGRTERDLCKYVRSFNGLEPRQRRAVLDALTTCGAVALVESAGQSGRGRKRLAWVAIEVDE